MGSLSSELMNQQLIREKLESLIETIERETKLKIFGLKYAKPDPNIYNPLGEHIELTVKVQEGNEHILIKR